MRPVTCEEVRAILWPLERPRAASSRELEAREHLAGCVRCRRFFERDAMLARALRASGRSAACPPPLRERVYDALARERTLYPPSAPPEGRAAAPANGRRRRADRRTLVAAAAVLLALAYAVLAPGDETRRTDAREYAGDYMRMAALDLADPGSPDTTAIARFYIRELGRRIVPVPLRDARVTRAVICYLEGKRGALIEYELGGTRLAHYRIPLDSEERPAGALTVTSAMGARVAVWRDAEYEHALVAEMPEGELERLAAAHFVAR